MSWLTRGYFSRNTLAKLSQVCLEGRARMLQVKCSSFPYLKRKDAPVFFPSLHDFLYPGTDCGGGENPASC